MKRTDSYVGTFHRRNLLDMEELDQVRKTVSVVNKQLKLVGDDLRFYVKCQGRLGPNNPNAAKYRERGYQFIRLEDAEHVDAYIYTRNAWS